MNECQKRGHSKLFITCEECHQVINEATFKNPYEWIGVNDQPPVKDIPILIWTEYLDFPISVYWKEDGTYGEPGYFQNGDEYYTKEEDIAHWMPLPLPPKDT